MDLPTDLVLRIASLLDQRSRIALALASTRTSIAYPTHLKHAFSKDDTLDDYVAFAKCASKAESLEVAVDPLSWSAVYPVLCHKRFDRVEIYPNDIAKIAMPCWIPDANHVVSGFFDPGAGVYTDERKCNATTGLALVNASPEKCVELPHFYPEESLKRICLDGWFSHKHRLPLVRTLEVKDMYRNSQMTKDEIDHLASSTDNVVICGRHRCESRSAFHCTSLHIDLENVGCVESVVSNPLVWVYVTDATDVSMQTHVRGKCSVCVAGCFPIARFDRLQHYITLCFPEAEHIDYLHLDLVDPV